MIVFIILKVTCGIAPGAPVTPNYQPPFKFTGKIHSVIVDVSVNLIQDREAEMRTIMARQ
jgi:arylsulfatase